MAITYLPLVGDNILVSIVGGAAANTPISKASVPGVAAAGRPGSLKFSSLLFYGDADGVDDDFPVLLTLQVPFGILPVPSSLAAIDANNPYDYSKLLPLITVQSCGAPAGFPTSLVDGSFLFVDAPRSIVTSAGVSGVNAPSSSSPYGEIDVSLFFAATTGGALPATLMLQLTVDWSASIAN